MADRRDLLLLDAELREAWGIDVGSIEEPGWWKRLERDCPSELVARFREAHEVYSEAEIDGGLQTELAERAFFDLAADLARNTSRAIKPFHRAQVYQGRGEAPEAKRARDARKFRYNEATVLATIGYSPPSPLAP